MTKHIITLGLLLEFGSVFGQIAPPEYHVLVQQADSLYTVKDYLNSGLRYSTAFQTFGGLGYSNDRYNAACSWALAGNADSAFYNLQRIVDKTKFADYNRIIADTDFKQLYHDARWTALLNLIKQNKEIAEANWDKPLVAQLDSIHTDDQQYRQQLEEINKKFGWDSKEMKALGEIIKEKDSINLIKVKSILDTRGWLGADIVGEQGNSTLFLVIQHADITTQEKYLPMMRAAVKNGKAEGSSLALLEDRVALRQGKKQIYGSQIGRDPQTQLYYVSPLDDPDNVDKRRAEVGLQSLAEYVNHWQIKWDIEQYKKDLPKLIEMQKEIK